MSTAAAPVRVHVPVDAALVMAAYEGEGIPGEWEIPIYDPVHWRQVMASVREGDEIAVVGEIDGRPAVMVGAVVIALHDQVQCIEVIA